MDLRASLSYESPPPLTVVGYQENRT
ncbi:hypothetical protein CCACVL1_05082 [Corchorus capsularis]|uniref:Uncharacterized protein n=1 Tax=Corchorus capsularis TaxID=210143 RepID=A0A1R3JMN0_COCAP|nr:hypothetical protein CCACVL1_05082 [Corchorus capsularis]